MEGLQPDEGKREGEKVGMTVPEQPGALKAMGGMLLGPTKGR